MGVLQYMAELNRPGVVEIGSLNGLANSSLSEISNSSLSPSFQCSTSHNFLPPSRQFWKAGEYSAGDTPRPFLKTELLDNAVDEACNGATSVTIDKIANLGNSHGLLIQDDGGGMNPESIRHCMSFGFSNKQSNSSIGQYGNGFKSSTMRLGADVIVFSRCLKERSLTQSVGILSYTFLRQTGCVDVLVPMVDYNFDLLTRGFVRMIRHSEKHFHDNLSTLLRWSPFSKEEELLNQFDLIERCGTRIIVFNLWLNDNGDSELDFDTNEKDILVSGALKMMHNSRFAKDLNEKHIGYRFHYSLRAYASILYLRLPKNFKIFLRGHLVDPHYIAEDLLYKQCIKYKPQVAGTIESEEIGTVIGFLNGAPHLNIHGFNIYHKYRLIMPFWRVVHKCKGVVGVLLADCLKPTHDKQDFERSDIFLKLEIRLKSMALEYWKYHRHLVGYTVFKVPSSTQLPSDYQMYSQETIESAQEAFPKRRKCAQEVVKDHQQLPNHAASFQINHHSSCARLACEEADVSQFPSSFTRPEKFHTNCGESSQAALPEKENDGKNIYVTEALKQQSVTGGISPTRKTKPQIQIQHGGRDRKQAFTTMVQRQKQLNEQCKELEKSVKELTNKEQRLRHEIELVLLVYDGLCAEAKSVGKMDRS